MSWLCKRITCLFHGHRWGTEGSYYRGIFLVTGKYCDRCGAFKRTGPAVFR